MSEVNKTYRDLVKEWYDNLPLGEGYPGENYTDVKLEDLYELVDRLGRQIYKEGYNKGRGVSDAGRSKKTLRLD